MFRVAVAGVRLVQVVLREVRGERLQGVRGQHVRDVQVVALDVRVGRGRIGVELEGHAAVLGFAGTLVVRVLDEGDLAVVLPGAFLLHLVRAVADRVLAVLLRILDGVGGQRHECRVAQAQRPVGFRLGQLDLDGGVVLQDQAGEGLGGGGGDVDVFAVRSLLRLGGADGVVALDGLEEAAVALRVGAQRGKVPGIDEALGGDFLAVGELGARLDLDGVVLAVRGFDGLGQGVDRLAAGVVAREALEEELNDAAAVDFAGVGGHQGVLRFVAVSGDDLVGVAGSLARHRLRCRLRRRIRSGRERRWPPCPVLWKCAKNAFRLL